MRQIILAFIELNLNKKSLKQVFKTKQKHIFVFVLAYYLWCFSGINRKLLKIQILGCCV